MAQGMERASRFAQHDLADFAQEFLRRNPLYREQWVRHESNTPDAVSRWGLEFRGRPGCGCANISGLLAI